MIEVKKAFFSRHAFRPGPDPISVQLPLGARVLGSEYRKGLGYLLVTYVSSTPAIAHEPRIFVVLPPADMPLEVSLNHHYVGAMSAGQSWFGYVFEVFDLAPVTP